MSWSFNESGSREKISDAFDKFQRTVQATKADHASIGLVEELIQEDLNSDIHFDHTCEDEIDHAVHAYGHSYEDDKSESYSLTYSFGHYKVRGLRKTEEAEF